MADVVLIGGSPSLNSRSAAVLEYIAGKLAANQLSAQRIDVRSLPAEDLLFARVEAPTIQAAVRDIEAASAVVIATPVYKAAYAGVLKALLDLLPQRIFAGKAVLPIATGGSLAHVLMLDYALKPVLSTLGASYILSGIYVVDSQFEGTAAEGYTIDAAIGERLDDAISQLADAATQSVTAASST